MFKICLYHRFYIDHVGMDVDTIDVRSVTFEQFRLENNQLKVTSKPSVYMRIITNNKAIIYFSLL